VKANEFAMLLVAMVPKAPMNLGLLPEAINCVCKSLLKLVICPKFILGKTYKFYLIGKMFFGIPGL
jgi:hypothetical protein